MKTATEKQAIYINNLSYIFYEMSGSSDTKMIMPFPKALQLTYPIADRMIKDLLRKINDKEYEMYFLDYKTSSDTLDRMKPIQLIQNYFEVDKFRYDKKNRILEVTTLHGNHLKIEGDITLRRENFSSSYEEFTTLLTQAIDESKRVNIYRIGDTAYLFIENKERDKLYKSIADNYNKMLKATNFNVIKNYKKEFILERGIKLLRVRDIDLYNELKPVFDNQNNVKFFKTIISYAENGLYGMTYKDAELINLQVGKGEEKHEESV